MDKIQKVIKALTPDLIEKHREALAEGYKDEVCPKCEQVFLSHHHFVNCIYAHCEDCPMVPSGAKSLLEQILA